MSEIVFIGKLFKNETNPWNNVAVFGVFITAFMLLVFMTVSEDLNYFYFGLLLLVILLIVVAANEHLTFNEMDERSIVITTEYIRIGDEVFDIHSIVKLGLYIDTFYGFRYGSTRRNSVVSSYGMDNRIYFRIGDDKHEYRFVITDAQNFFNLYHIIKTWRNNGIIFALKEVYGEEFVRRAIQSYQS